jgi:hypothetical protein
LALADAHRGLLLITGIADESAPTVEWVFSFWEKLDD